MLQTLQNIDFSVLHWLDKNLQNPFLDPLMIFVSLLGNGGVIWIVLALVLLCFKKYRLTAIKVLLALLLVLVIYNNGLKVWVGRLRPFQIDPNIELLIKEPGEFSFPSGHTTSSLAAATVLYLEKVPMWYLALGLALLISYSRVYLLVHFPSDVLAGLFLGALMGKLAVLLVDAVRNRWKMRGVAS